MTTSDHDRIGPPEASPDYERTIHIRQSPDAIFNALTSPSALTAWWTPAVGSAETGGDITFSFPDPLHMHVDLAERATKVQWTVSECEFMPDWVGTRPTFTISPADNQTSELHFRHQGLTAQLDCIEICTRGWDHFVVSLRQYVETGRGMPNGSTEDEARREQEQLPRRV